MTLNLTAERLAMILLAWDIPWGHARAMNSGHWGVIATAARTTQPTSQQRSQALGIVWKHQNEVADAA